VAALIIAVVAAVMWFVPPLHKLVADLIWPPSVRLAVLPFEGPPEFRTASEGAAQEVLSRLRGMSSGRRSVLFLDPSTIQKNRVETPEQADKVLHATHALQVKVQQEGNFRSVYATVTDLQSHLVTRDLSVRYPEGSIGKMPGALAGLVAAALHLSEGSADKLSPAATSPYIQGLALLHHGSESADEAIVLFQQAKQLDPSSPLPHTGLIEAYVAKYRMTRDRQYMEKAEQELALVQSMNPNSPRVLLASGLMHEAKSQYLKALEDYRRVQELEPKNASALLKVGDIYKGLDMPEDAAKAYMAAMSLDPNYYEPYEFLGELYFSQGRFEESADYFRKTVERAPGMFDAYTNLGSLLVELQRYDEAEKALLESLRIKRTGRALNSMGAMRAYQGRDAEAVAYYTEALASDPNERIYLMNIADCDRRLGRKREAAATYVKALQLTEAELAQNPRLAETRAYVGYFEAMMGNRDRAHQQIAEALALAPADAEVQRRAVLTYEALGERDLALPILRSLSLGVLKQIARHPDMADFSKDPRFKEVMIAKGGQ
jgi:tetratricopeptide (TPR) repeat protein